MMETVKFNYNDIEIDFLPTGNDDLMINATQMAKVFDKRVDVFTKTDHSKEFINELQLTPFGVSLTQLNKDEIIKTVNGVNTWMYRILAIKFAAWINPQFEVWIYTTIDKILFGNYREIKEATIAKLKAEQLQELKKQELMEKYPELSEYFELEARITAAQRNRMKAVKQSVNQLRMDLFD